MQTPWILLDVLFLIEWCIEITLGIPMPAKAALGPDLRIHHFGGIMAHSEAVVRECSTHYNEVTLGGRGGGGEEAPRVEYHVLVKHASFP